jgi:hypothetical protein
MPEMIANRDLKYPQPGFKTGERFTADVGSARLLAKLHWASLVDEEEEKPKRKYRRRDMTSE